MIPEAEDLAKRWETGWETRLVLTEAVGAACRAYAVRVLEEEAERIRVSTGYPIQCFLKLADRIKAGKA